MSFRNLIDIEDLTIAEWNNIYSLTCDIIDRPADFTDALRGKVMASLFYEPSTRTNFSFQTAMMRLGGSVFGFSDPKSSSVSKGETLKDTIKMVSAYSDIVVMRSPQEGSVKAASLYCECPIINAGDGSHMHPTQTMADLTTISRLRGGIGGLNIGLCGDLKNGRTVHSLIQALAKFPDIRFYLISPRDLSLPMYMKTFLRANNQWLIEATNLESTIPQLDVLYMTRIQRERFTDPLEYDRLKGVYILTHSKLYRAKKDLLVMHPLPRVDEISLDVDDDPRAVYFEQARYGMYVRMALLLKLTNLGNQKPNPVPIGKMQVCRNPNCVTGSEPYLPPTTHTIGKFDYCDYCDHEII